MLRSAIASRLNEGKPDRWCYDFGLAQSGLWPGFEIDDLQLQAAPALPIIEGRGENEAALTAGRHQFRCPLGQVEADRGKPLAILLDAKTEMALPPPDTSRLPDHAHRSGQEQRPRIPRTV